MSSSMHTRRQVNRRFQLAPWKPSSDLRKCPWQNLTSNLCPPWPPISQGVASRQSQCRSTISLYVQIERRKAKQRHRRRKHRIRPSNIKKCQALWCSQTHRCPSVLLVQHRDVKQRLSHPMSSRSENIIQGDVQTASESFFNPFWSSEDVMEFNKFETAQWFFQSPSKAEGGNIYDEPVPFIADIHTKLMLAIVNATAMREKPLIGFYFGSTPTSSAFTFVSIHLIPMQHA